MKGLPLKETHELDPTGKWLILKEQFKVPYRESVMKQLESWVAGKPIHNEYADECCPDFSCCVPDNLWPEETRKVFVGASEEVRFEMLLNSLSTCSSSEKVYVTGTYPIEKPH